MFLTVIQPVKPDLPFVPYTLKSAHRIVHGVSVLLNLRKLHFKRKTPLYLIFLFLKTLLYFFCYKNQIHILNLSYKCAHICRQLSVGPVNSQFSLSPAQLSGWTSNLVDIVMAHHFSTVSFSCTVLLTTEFFSLFIILLP